MCSNSYLIFKKNIKLQCNVRSVAQQESPGVGGGTNKKQMEPLQRKDTGVEK